LWALELTLFGRLGHQRLRHLRLALQLEPWLSEESLHLPTKNQQLRAKGPTEKQPEMRATPTDLLNVVSFAESLSTN
jgi:hypothetical protein